MHVTSGQRLDDGSLGREFTVGEMPRISWTPTSLPAPPIVLGHPGGRRTIHGSQGEPGTRDPTGSSSGT